MHIDVSYILYHFNNKKGFLSIYVYGFFFLPLEILGSNAGFLYIYYIHLYIYILSDALRCI